MRVINGILRGKQCARAKALR